MSGLIIWTVSIELRKSSSSSGFPVNSGVSPNLRSFVEFGLSRMRFCTVLSMRRLRSAAVIATRFAAVVGGGGGWAYAEVEGSGKAG